MNTICSASEIVESAEIDYRSKMNEKAAKHRLKPGLVYSIEEDINKLFESMEQKRRSGLACQASKDNLSKRAMKRPMRSVLSSSSKIGFSDSVSLKQAFRGLSISQASEMAAIKRSSKPANSSRSSNFVTGGYESLLKVTLAPEESTSKPSEKTKSFPKPNSDNRIHSILLKVDERLRIREKVESSQSSKNNSIGGCSSSTSISYESTLTGHRPHMSKGLRSEVIQHFLKQNGSLSLKHFKLIKKLGGGDIGTVYLAELMGTSCLFALKVMDNDFLISRKKMLRAETEREILQMLDHPFLPSLFAYFTADKFSVFVVEYCPGGDLHTLRQKQPEQRFSEQAARFYVGEVLLALEYLHMLGVVYRDLKPENVLLREDGHIILSDFELCLRCNVSPMLLKTSPVSNPSTIRETDQCPEPKCIHPLSLCLQPPWQVPCFTPRLLSAAARTLTQKADVATQVSPLPQLVAEPTSARSNSFVGTHEYLAPEIIRGDGHGSAVDWWALGIFLYELVYGKTPFKGPMDEDTLSNIVLHGVEFPASPTVSTHTRDLIGGLLVKDPENRLGSVRGAPEIKQHPFFDGLNWALVRCTVPPELPTILDSRNANADVAIQNYEDITGENLGFEMF